MTENLIPSENTGSSFSRAMASKRMNWASSESRSRDTCGDTEPTYQLEVPRRDIFKTPPPKSSNDESSKAGKSSVLHHDSSSARQPYDIATLMSFRGSLAGISVFAKIKPEALAENLFPYISGYRLQRPSAGIYNLPEQPSHSLGPSGARAVPYPSLTTKFAGTPERQPIAPPDNPRLQQHEGFVRFLKQHASPPHHRVTAGGRIVPAGPHSPPPMFDYASLTGLADHRRGNLIEQSLRQQGSNGNGGTRSALWVPPLSPLEYQLRNPAGLQAIVTPYQSLSTNSLPNALNGGSSNFLAAQNSPAPSSSLIPLGTFEDGSIMTSCNGMMYRMYWNGTGTVIEPLSAIAPQLPNIVQSEPDAKELPNQARSSFTGPSHIASKQSRTLANATNQSRVSSSGSLSSQKRKELDDHHIKVLESRQNSLKAELQDLDRHIALHHYELRQEQRTSLISQRRSLVEEIDQIRRVRDPSSQELPIISIKELEQRAIHRRSQSRSTKGINIKEENQDKRSLRKPSGTQAHTSLSPNAPPFVPSSSRAMVPNMVPASAASQSVQPIQPLSGCSLMHAANTSAKGVNLNRFPELAEHAHTRRFPQNASHERDASDPAMRILHESDIAYSAKFEHDSVNGKKRFCTNLSEFQEAIRRVRQQARLHGCAGGSSKDPAYDAEQDIWWAICDQDPIPLPSEIPDHISNPRPWDWNNSAFNSRHVRDLRAQSSVSSSRHHSSLNDQKPSNAKFRPGKDGTRTSQSTELQPSLKGNLGPAHHESARRKSKSEGAQVHEQAPSRSKASLGELETTTSQGPAGATGSTSNSKEVQQPQRQFSLVPQNQSQKPAVEECTTNPQISKTLNTTATAKIELSPLVVGTSLQPSVLDNARKQGSSGTHTLDAAQHNDSELPSSVPNKEVAEKQSCKALKRMPSKHKVSKTTPFRDQRHSVKKSLRGKKSFTISEDTQGTSLSSNIGSQLKDKKGREKGHRNLISRTTQQLSPRTAAKKAKELYERSRSRSPLKKQPQFPQPEASTGPRVQLPTMSFASANRETAPIAFHSNEVKSFSVSNPAHDTFLRDMLRGRRYSFAYPKVKGTDPKPSTFKPALTQQDDSEQANKENQAITIHQTMGSKASNTEHDPLPISEHNGLLASKAPSSLASSAYHASGFLPQFDGAGRSQTSNVHHQHGAPASHRQAKVNLPSDTSYDGRTSPLGAISHNTGRGWIASHSKQTLRISRPSVSFGYDGSADEETSSSINAPKSALGGEGQESPSKTTQVTEADFTKRRSDPNNEAHYKEVDKFFVKLAEDEKESMTRRLRQNTKTD